MMPQKHRVSELSMCLEAARRKPTSPRRLRVLGSTVQKAPAFLQGKNWASPPSGTL